MNKNIIIGILALGVIGLIFVTFHLNKNISQSSSNDSLFDKKRQCSELSNDAQNKISNTFTLAKPYFYEIFYSPKTDSCLYTYGLLLSGESPNETGSFVLADYFSGKTISDIHYDNGSKDETKWSSSLRDPWSKTVDSYRP